MSEIKKLTIENFQSHKRTELEPAPAGKLTVIVGPSDSGKTAVIRALKWLYYNRPQGDGFTRTGASFVRVTLTTDKGTVNRHRSSAVNRYLVTGDNLPPVPLEGFGNDVPLEIQEITGVRQTMIGDMPLNLNLAEQLDGPFLGSSISDPVRARILGKLAGTEEVDHAGKQLGTDLYRRGQDLKRAEEDIERLTEELKQFEKLPRLRELVEQLGWMIEEACAGVNRVRALRSLSVALRDRQSQADKWRWELAKYCKLDEAIEAKAQIDSKAVRRAKLAGTQGLLECSLEQKDGAVSVLQRYYMLENASAYACDVDRGLSRRRELCKLQDRLHQAEDTRSAADEVKDKLARKVGWAEIDFKEAAKLIQRRQGLVGFYTPLYSAKAEVGISQTEAESWQNDISELVTAYRDALVMAGQCPTCGGQVDPEKLKGVV